MPFVRASDRAPSAQTLPLPVRLLRVAGTLVLASVVLMSVLLLAVRFVVFPRVESWRPDIAEALSQKIGVPVEIDSIGTGWDGWNPKLSIRGFRLRDRAGAMIRPLVELPRVDLVVAWTSLPLFELRLKEIFVEGPRLSVRRDAAGRLHVAGIEIDPTAVQTDTGIGDWLLRQHRIIIHDGLIAWNDDLRNAPQLVLDHVDLRLEQGFGHHRFGLKGTPPPELASPLDLRGDIIGRSLDDWQHAHGQVYVRLDYADVAAWREWLPLPVPVDSGKGALRVWFEFAQGEARDIVADLELADVRARLGADLAPVALAHLAGRAGWRHDDRTLEVYTRALEATPMDGPKLPPINFTYLQTHAEHGAPSHGSIVFDRLEITPLAGFAAQLPLPERWRRDIARFVPRGTARDGKFTWLGEPDAPAQFAVSGSFSELGLEAQDRFPGFLNASGSLDLSDRGGTLKIASRALSVALPRVFAEALVFDTLTGDVRFNKTKERWEVQVDALAFANGDGAGTATGTWRELPEGPGEIDLRAQLARADVEHLYRYIPNQMNPHARDWLRNALIEGTSKDARVAVSGNLAEFPFPQNRGGRFNAAIKAQNGTLNYAEHWPPVTDIDADVRFEGTHLAIDVHGGHVLGAVVEQARAEIVDLRDPHPVLKVSGHGSGPTSEFIAFVNRTPLAEWTGHPFDNAQANGNGTLNLKFDLPLTGPLHAIVAGEYQLVANQLKFPGVPQLKEINGKLEFTDREMRARDVTAEALGGTLKVQIASAEGRAGIHGTGTVNTSLLRTEFDAPLSDRISGTTDYQIALQIRPEAASWMIESSLKGAAINLPAPLGKTADESTPLRIERREPRAREDSIAIDYGSGVRFVVHRQATGTGYDIDRGLLLLGRGIDRASEPERPGFWVRADLALLNLDDWLAVRRSLPQKPGPEAGAVGAAEIDLQGIDLATSTLIAMGRKLNEFKVSARRAGDDWRLTLDGRDLAGTAVWRGASAALPNGLINARLTRLSLASSSDVATISEPTGPLAATPPEPSVSSWPEIDLASDALISRDHELGKLEVLAQPMGSDWQIRKLSLTNDAGAIDANGWWRLGRTQQTKLDVAIDVKDAGAFLAHFGVTNGVRNAPTRIDGQLSWAGAPSDFDYPTLTGMFRLNTGAGQFTRIDPGMGRLLGVLSLQSLPRRATLDFQDVFSEGLAFDSLTGTVRIQTGVMHTDDLKLIGPAANVDIAGEVDLARETQKLKVRVLPSLSSSFSAGAAALFLANPLIGAAVGAGTFLAQKLLKDPLEQLFSYEYTVTGSWVDPVVDRVTGRTASAMPESFTK